MHENGLTFPVMEAKDRRCKRIASGNGAETAAEYQLLKADASRERVLIIKVNQATVPLWEINLRSRNGICRRSQSMYGMLVR